MNTLSINRRRNSTLTPKELLRHHIERLSLDQQFEFILSALQLISTRPVLQQAEVIVNERRPRLSRNDSAMW
jgi:hypothetical protein